MNRYCEELELEQKVMRDGILAAAELTEKDIKHNEFLVVKETFAALTFELESLRKKMKELEEELAESSNEMHKLEEAEMESKRGLQFEKMLELAQYKEREMEDHMDNLQKELKVLFDKIAEIQHAEEIYTESLEISAIQEKLEMSRSTIVDLECMLVSKESIIHDLTQELSFRKASEEQMKANVLELESQLSASKEELQAKIMKLEETEMKLEEQEKDKERLTSSKNQLLWHKMTLQSLQKDLSDLTREKVALQSTVGELNLKLSMNEDLRRQLETKLKLSDQNFNVTESLLSQALSHSKELEQKQKSLEDDMRKLTDVASKKNIELEDLVQASKLAEDGIKKKLRESEMRLSSAEKHNMDLEQQVSHTEIRCLEAESEVEELKDQLKQLTTLLRKIDEENSVSRRLFQGYENKIGQLESSLNRSFRRNTELEKELNYLLGKSTEDERANTTNQHSPLEDKVQSDHLKSENALKVVDELESSLETDDSRIQQLEQLLTRTEAKCRCAEEESKQNSSKISALYAEIEAYQARSTSLEAVLRAATEKERELTDKLNATIKERQYIGGLSDIQAKKLKEVETLIHELEDNLKFLEGKIRITEEELKASSLREKELVEKLRYAADNLKNQGRVLEEVTAINEELKSQNEFLLKDSECKLQEALLKFKLKESEIKELNEKLNFLEEEKVIYTDQAVEATEKVASLKAELEANALKLVSFSNKVEELNQEVSESHLNAEHLFLENEKMAQTNSKLGMDLEAHQIKLDKLNQLLNFNDSEMEANSAGQLASHLKTIAKLADENSRCFAVQSSSESCLKETEVRLHETIEKLKQKSFEVENLTEKISSLETQLKNYEEQASESTAIISNQKDRLADTILRLGDLETFIEQLRRNFDESETVNEGLTRENICLSQEMLIYADKMKELQIEFDIVVAEKEAISIQLQSFKKEMEVLEKQLRSDMEKHQLQMNATVEEHGKLTEMYQNARKELEEVVIHFEEQLNQQKHREVSLNSLVENLKAELADKSLMQDRISEMQQRLFISQKKNMEVTRSIQKAMEKEAMLTSKLEEHTGLIEERDTLIEVLRKVQNELNLAHRTIEEQKMQEYKNEKERKASMKQSLGALETKYKRRTVLEKQVEELMQKLHQAEPQYPEKIQEESKKPAYISAELTQLKQRHGQTAEYKRKIAEIEKKLKLVSAALEEEVQKLTTQTEPDGEMDVLSRSKKESSYENQTLETSSLHITTQGREDSSGAIALKFILGVALVSMIIGIILGKRY